MLGGGPPGDEGYVLLLIYINVCAFQIGHFTRTAERICHDALSFKGLDIRSRPLTFQPQGFELSFSVRALLRLFTPALDCRGIGRLLRCPRQQRTATCLCLFRG